MAERGEVRVTVPGPAVRVVGEVAERVVQFFLEGDTARRVLVVAIVPAEGGAIVARTATTTELWEDGSEGAAVAIVEDLRAAVEAIAAKGGTA